MVIGKLTDRVYIGTMGYREKYLRRAKVAAWVLRFVPFLRMAGLNGSLVRGDETRASDIDFLIVARRGRLYTARLFATVLVHLTGYRRHKDRVAGRICLNCYLSDDNPDILPNDKKSRQKVANAYKYLIPLVGCECQEKRFHQANRWIGGYGIRGKEYSRELRSKVFKYYPLHPIALFDCLLGGWFGDHFEILLMSWQRRRILVGRDGFDELVATEREIRLHPKKVHHVK